MKDRLTKRKGNHVYINTETIPRDNCYGEYGFHFCQYSHTCPNIADRKCPMLMVLDRLAEYEDEAEKGGVNANT